MGSRDISCIALGPRREFTVKACRFAIAVVACACAMGCATRGTTTDVTIASPSRMTEEPAVLAVPTGNVSGTLLLPAAGYPVPVVLIVAGSGPTDRNGNTPALPGANNSLKMLADGLASRGIASLRYDKRGIAASRNAATKEEDIRFNHFIEDAGAWVRKLRADPRFSTITVAGHSEGSAIAMVAAKEADADGYVSLAGAGRTAREILTEQLSAQLPPPVFAQAVEAMKQLEQGQRPDSFPPMLTALFRPSVQPYLISWFAVNPVRNISKLDIPVLIVQGTTDLQINERDARALAAAKPEAKLVIIEGMNHVLKHASGPIGEQMKSYSDSTIVVVPRLIDEVAGFVRDLRRVRDTALGIDKLKHFLFAGYVESVGFAGMRALGAGRNASFAVAVGGVAVLSVAKEMRDRRTHGLFSFADLVWDALGAGAAYLILSRTPR